MGYREPKPAGQRLQAKRCVPAASARRVPRPDDRRGLFFSQLDPEKTRSTSATRDRDRLPLPLTLFPTSVRTRDRELVEPSPPPRIPGSELRAGVTTAARFSGGTARRCSASRVPARPRARRVAGGGPPGARCSAKLASAAERHARELDQRDCLLVVKDGVIVHETYREGGDADTLHYLDGVAAPGGAAHRRRRASGRARPRHAPERVRDRRAARARVWDIHVIERRRRGGARGASRAPLGRRVVARHGEARPGPGHRAGRARAPARRSTRE